MTLDVSPIPRGRPSLTIGERKAIEEVGFLRQHPEMHGYIGMLLSTALVCEDARISIDNVVLEEAHIHVFGDEGTAECPRCRRQFDIKKKMQEGFY